MNGSSVLDGLARPTRAFGLALAFGVLAACGAEGSSQFGEGGCEVDADCKGDRICSDDGKCVDPNAVDGGGAAGTGANGGAGSGAGGAGVSVQPCGPPSGDPPQPGGGGTDVTPPVVTCIGFDKTGYVAGEIGHIEYRATDDVSGITDFEGNCWSIDSETGNSNISVCDLVEPLGGDLYRIPFEVGEFVENGEFYLARLNVHDNAGNGLDLDAEFLDATYEGTSLAVPHTSVGASSTDTTPPAVTQIDFGQSSYAKGTLGNVRYHASDDLSGITDFEGNCWGIDSASGATTLHACGAVVPLGGGLYELEFEIDSFAESGTYFLRHATVHDLAGNYFELSAEYGDAVFEGTGIGVPTVTIQP